MKCNKNKITRFNDLQKDLKNTTLIIQTHNFKQTNLRKLYQKQKSTKKK